MELQEHEEHTQHMQDVWRQSQREIVDLRRMEQTLFGLRAERPRARFGVETEVSEAFDVQAELKKLCKTTQTAPHHDGDDALEEAQQDYSDSAPPC